MTEILNSPINIQSQTETGVNIELETFVVAVIADDSLTEYSKISEIINQLHNYHNEVKDINDNIAPPRLVIREQGTNTTEDITMFLSEDLGWNVDNIEISSLEEFFHHVSQEANILLILTKDENSLVANLKNIPHNTDIEIRTIII